MRIRFWTLLERHYFSGNGFFNLLFRTVPSLIISYRYLKKKILPVMIKLVIKPLVYKSQAESLYRDCCILSETEECLSVVVFLTVTVEWLEQAQQFRVFVCCSISDSRAGSAV